MGIGMLEQWDGSYNRRWACPILQDIPSTEYPTMRYTKINSIAAVSVLAVLAACSQAETTADKTDEIAEKQAEIERLQAEVAAQNTAEEAATAAAAATATQAAATAAKAPPASSPVAVTTPRPAPKPAAPRPVVKASTPKAPPVVAVTSISVPAGTSLPLSLSTSLSSKSAKVGDSVRAVVTSDVQVGGRTAISSGTTVAGSVVKVVSGSDKIGGTPTLVVAFDRLEMPGGRDVPISGEFTSKGNSDTTRDTVKIVGGAAAGALLGDQVSSKDRGKVIGGILGAAAGAAAAQKTGTEVRLTEGTALTLSLASAVEITR